MFHNNVSRYRVQRLAHVAVLTVAAVATSVGCQLPAMRGKTDVASQPPANSVSMPISATLSDQSSAPPVALPSQATGQPPVQNAAPQATSAEPPVQQVGFVEKLRCNAAARCGSCQACQQCASPDSTCSPPIVLGRPLDPQEYICNGGDEPPPARVLKNDTVAGVEPQDAIIHYTTQAGDVYVQPSNRVCLYAPRFGAVRQISGAVAGEKAIGPQRTYMPVGPNRFDLDQPSLAVTDIDELAHADVARRIDAMRDRNRGVPVESILQPVLAEDVLQVLVMLDAVALVQLDEAQIVLLQRGAVAAQTWMIRDAVEVMIHSLTPPVLIRDARVEGLVRYDFPDEGRLQIIKVADKDHAQQGEEVGFAIHVKNVGDSPVDHVELIDSLVSRLEYVDGSQKCDREADFETRVNSAGSTKMKWTLKEPLAVGDTALIEFKCRVR